VSKYSYKISLRIFHPTADPAAFTEALGIQPGRSWLVSAPRTTPRGTPLKGLNAKSYWTARLADGASIDAPLADAVHDVLDRLRGRKGFFRDVVKSGGRAELFIGWFLDENSGDLFDHQLLARLAALKIDLSFDVYPSASEEG
jgi:hypothetical protein